MNSGWLANVQLLSPCFLVEHFPVLDYKCIAFGKLISQKTQLFVQKYELSDSNSPLYILGKKFQIFVTFIIWNINAHCLGGFLHTSYKTLQSSSDISKSFAKHRNCKKFYQSFLTVFLRTSWSLLKDFLQVSPHPPRDCAFSISFHLHPHLLLRHVHFSGINNFL